MERTTSVRTKRTTAVRKKSGTSVRKKAAPAPEKGLLPDKELFNIGEACRILQVPAHTLRYWETRLRLLRPVRRESGHRRYTRRDIEKALRIKDLLENHKMTPAGVRRVLSGRSRPGGGAGPAAGLPPIAVRRLKEARDELRRIASDL